MNLLIAALTLGLIFAILAIGVLAVSALVGQALGKRT